jgi:carboxymethylenebutenolidase
MKKASLPIFAVLFAVSAFAADSRPVSYKSGDETVQGVLYAPVGKGPFPALIVIHEYWGLNDWVKDQASKLADQGYVTLAVDLYRGKVATTPDMAHELMRGVPEDRAKRDLHAAFEFLAAQPNVKKNRIGSIGWCMGGGYSLDVALQEPTLAADVINYGHLATDLDALKKINAPILGLFGAQDRGITPDDVKKFGATLDQLGKKIDVKIYDDAGHAFENPNNQRRIPRRRCRQRLESHRSLPRRDFEEIARTGRPPRQGAPCLAAFARHGDFRRRIVPVIG